MIADNFWLMIEKNHQVYIFIRISLIIYIIPFIKLKHNSYLHIQYRIFIV